MLTCYCECSSRAGRTTYLLSDGVWVHSFRSRYLNVLIKTLQLHGKVENLKIRRLIRKLAAFQWAEQFPLHACNSNWGPHTRHTLAAAAAAAKAATTAAAGKSSAAIILSHASVPLALGEQTSFGNAHAPNAQPLGPTRSGRRRQAQLGTQLVCARTRHCAHHGREWARANRCESCAMCQARINRDTTQRDGAASG